MLVTFASHQGDIALLIRLLRWIRALDGTLKNHDALLAFDAATPIDQASEAINLAGQIFHEVRTFVTDKHYSGWPVAPNVMWWAISKYVQEQWPQPWLMMEPDAVPLCRDWLELLELSYAREGKPFMGFIEDCQMPMMPPKVMSGVACYPANCYELIPPMPGSQRPWNTDASSITVPNGAHTQLICDFFGQPKLPPVFVESRTPTSPSHHFTLDWLPKEAVLFHRDKNHSLIPLLAKRLGIEWRDELPRTEKPKLAVVFPVHPGDVHLALHHALWLRKMGRKWSNRAVIAHDPFTARPALAQLHAHLSQCFAEVEVWKYGLPPVRHYPYAANFAFQSAARKMWEQDSPWLWMEADAVALKPDWLDQLEAEYYRAGKSWMGPHVKGMSHSNGTMIYPCDAAARMPRAMQTLDGAFDHTGAPDIMHDCHDASVLIMHVWSILYDMPCQTGGGSVPGPITADQARRWIPRAAVMTHRWKTNHLLNLLLTGQYRH